MKSTLSTDPIGPLVPPSVRVAQFHELKELGLINREGSFFPCGIHYPPITMYPPATETEFLAGYVAPEDGRFVLYLHIPFCARRCTFCHYPCKTGASDAEQDDYIDLITREMDLWCDRLGVDRFKAWSILVAGGTPTFLSPKRFARFHEQIMRRIDMSECTQISYDVHPLDLIGPEGRERLGVMRGHGCDRITMGLQSLDDGILKHMNRGHGEAEAYEAIDAMYAAGISDVCIELIFGYPGVTVDVWRETLRKAVATGVEEIQFYRLKITPYGDSPGPIERLYRRHPERFPRPSEAIAQKQEAVLCMAEHGYYENLTRVFSQKPDQISHYATDQCCRQLDCLGFGQSAFSSLRDRFCINTPDLGEYARRVRDGRLPLDRGMVRNQADNLRWHLVLPLKNSWVNKDNYKARTGEDASEVFRPELDALARWGLLHEDDEVIRLTPMGRFFADEVCAQFHDPAYLPFPLDHYADGPLKLARKLPERFAGPASVPPVAPTCGLRSPSRTWPWTDDDVQPGVFCSAR